MKSTPPTAPPFLYMYVYIYEIVCIHIEISHFLIADFSSKILETGEISGVFFQGEKYAVLCV